MGSEAWKSEPIAIVGSSCRLPGGATSPSKLWTLLENPRDIAVEIPPERFNKNGFYHEDGNHHGSTNAVHAYLCDEDMAQFDYKFFGIHRREAEAMDPQQRILLEVVYEGLESAGYSISQLKDSQTGVFVGQMTDDYHNALHRDLDNVPKYAATGISRAILANRISYFFDWHGPSMNVDTACSSSLVALHQAVQSLRSGESALAIAAGANLILGPENYIIESKLHMLSPSGRCRMWDADADGYARGEGFVVLVLKTLQQAISDNDHIECVIRETGVNQDGRTSGLTVPSATAQAALIESTYAKCGLNHLNIRDRCQYFEAHGTGTLAGDPKEAEAIQRVFFPGLTKSQSSSKDGLLYVGSIKTVVGHSEGAAGLAAVLKASLAIQNATIPPNMHFNNLNPTVATFYHPHLSVPTKPLPWPDTPRGSPRRASINNFGFGGTNAHVIIEGWPANDFTAEQVSHNPLRPCGPFTLSAHSQPALMRAVGDLLEALKSSRTIDLPNLAWTLQSYRTEFSFKAAFSAVSRQDLIENLESFLERNSSRTQSGMTLGKPINVSDAFPLRILGVFTGQGAQWQSMGARLYEQSFCFRTALQQMDESLASLPDAPPWSLVQELIAPEDPSLIHIAEISQPLTTAIQVALVDLLRASGVTFSATVGHSSGEIAATYGAGYLSASDAIRIAYYRGLHAKLARSSTGQPGRMMAVRMEMEEASIFCRREQFFGRLAVAANNSKASVTLSGDDDAIEEARLILDGQATSAKVLKVDKAYHSHHMEPCLERYLESLHRCMVLPKQNRTTRTDKCKWYSSVYGSNGRSIDNISSFKDTYWGDNLIKPVLFFQALERAIKEDNPFDLVLEVGPHATLRGPVTDTFKSLTGTDIPYQGVLKRDEHDMKAFTAALAFIWSNVRCAAPVLNLQGFREACFGYPQRRPKVLKDLPPYGWDHSEHLFKESRKSKAWRLQSQPSHELLGRATTYGDGKKKEMHWRNILKIGELEWLKGHQFQGQTLLPASAYVSMAIEAARRITPGVPIKVIELSRLKFHRAITLDENDSGVETSFIIKTAHVDTNFVTVEFSCYSSSVDAVSGTPNQMEYTNFGGCATILLGIPMQEDLPPRTSPILPMTSVDTGRFYSWASSVGLQYSGDFVVDSIKRRQNVATVTVKRARNSQLHVHPATLDAAFHGLFAAYSFPGDHRLQVPYLPSTIDKVRVSMATPEISGAAYPTATQKQQTETRVIADCYVGEESSTSVCGDVDIFSASYYPEIQVQGLTCSRITIPTEEDDRHLFHRLVWKRDVSTGLAYDELSKPSNRDTGLYNALERTAYFFMRKICEEINPIEIPMMEEHHQFFMDWCINHALPMVELDLHPRVRPEWASDTFEMIVGFRAQNPDIIEFEVLHALGERLLSVLRGKTPALQVLMENDMLNRLYQQGRGLHQANEALGLLIGQISHQFPRMRILEIGGGTGSATRVALEYLGGSFESYTFTDISVGFFENAQSTFSEYKDKMIYSVLDIERSPLEQGFEEHSFDLIIASNVIHATSYLSKTLKNCRKLLKPGGRMLLLEITEESLYLPFIISSLPGWWLGRDDGRIYQPTVSDAEWDSVLRETGFSGVDYISRDFQDVSISAFSVMVSQAVDEQIKFLRQPLAVTNQVPMISTLLIVGGKTTEVTSMALELNGILEPFALKTIAVDELEDTQVSALEPGSTVLCLSDLEGAVLDGLTEQSLRSIQLIFDNAKHILWVTKGRCWENPAANMIVGVGRSAMMESPHLRIQFVDVEGLGTQGMLARKFAEILLRMTALDLAEYKNVLWSNETEVILADGDTLIPRILPDAVVNARFNSGRRLIERQRCLKEACISIVNEDGVLTLRDDVGMVDNGSLGEECCYVNVHSSSLFALSFDDCSTPLHLCFGSILGSEQQVLALSHTNASSIKVPLDRLFTLTTAVAIDKILTTIICESILSNIPRAVWLHDVGLMAEDASRIGRRRGIDVFLTSSSPVSNPKIRFIHPLLSKRSFERLLPSDTRSIVCMCAEGNCTLEGLLRQSVNNDNLIQHFVRDRNKDGVLALPFTLERVRKIIQEQLDAGSMSICNPGDSSQSQAPIPINMISKLSGHQTPTRTIDWTVTEAIFVKIAPLQYSELFSSHKTYFLVGLSGELGMSLIRWMMTNGARHFAVTSRNPALDSDTLKYFEKQGADLKVFALDITDKHALQQVHHEIVASMPPIAGVANAAMVLCDKPFGSMTLQDMETVMQPKVQGTKNLDELFHSTELDFFILFSSLSSIAGNQGQSNYGAANMFMSGLAAQRRKRGVVGSVMHIGMILGIGYVMRSLDEDNTIESQLRRSRFPILSEADFHTMFGEAIVSGRLGTNTSPDIITGFTDVPPDAPWSRTPLFSHLLQSHNIVVKDKNFTQPLQSVADSLASTSDVEERLLVLETAFAKKVAMMLQMDSNGIDRGIPLVSLGIDSLVAVEARSWFLKELCIDMPILKLLSGASLTRICREAITVVNELKAEAPGSLESNSSLTPNISTAMIQHPVSSPSNDDDRNDSEEDLGSGEPKRIGRRPDVVPSKSHLSMATYERVAEMSQAQTRLFFLHELLEDKSAHTGGYLGTYQGHLDVKRLQQAFWDVCMRHESLRSSYFIEESTGQPIQAVNPEPRLLFEHKKVQDQNKVIDELNGQRKFVFDIEHGYLMKIVVLSQSSTLHHIIFLHHHIALDGTSWHIFINDLHKVYAGKAPRSPAQQAVDIHTRRQSSSMKTKIRDGLAFWVDLHRDPHQPLLLPHFAKAKHRQMVKTYEMTTFDLEIDYELVRSIRQKAQALGMTPFHFYLSAFAVFISRCFDVYDFSVGVVDANRADTQENEAVGYFLNMLPLRFRLDVTQNFDKFAQQSRDMVLSALANSSTPFDAILDRLQASRSGQHHPLFQVALNYRQGYIAQTPFGDGEIKWNTNGITPKNPYDFTVDITEASGSTYIHWTSQDYLYGESDTKSMMKWYIRVLESLSQKDSVSLGECSLSNNADLQHAMDLSTSPRMEISWKGTIVDQVERMAAMHADSIAVVDGYGSRLRYSEMMNRVYAIATVLQSTMVPPGSHIGVLLDPTVDYVCSLLAIMLVGSVCIPLDLRNPQQRLSSMLLDCRPSILIYHRMTKYEASELASQHKIQVLNLDKLPIATQVRVNNFSKPEQPALILYTSGSTGTPKGVVISHMNILSNVYCNTMVYKLGQEVVLQQSSPGFDLSVDQIFTALTNGGSLIIVSREDRGDPVRLATLMMKENVTYTLFVPTEYLSLLEFGSQILRECKSWRLAFSLGEKLTHQVLQGFQKLNHDHVQLINSYGPTEATIACSKGIIPYDKDEHLASEEDHLWPLPNHSVFVINEKMKVVPIGFPGEIAIAGFGVTLGYHNRPDETNNKFVEITTPCDSSDNKTLRAYRTGDRGRILDNGSLQFLGRLAGDSQVKIHGIRVELDEISNAMIKHSHGVLHRCAVSYRSNLDLLVGFVVFDVSFLGNKETFVEQLKTTLPLPSYMRPTLIVSIDKIPTNVNGKQDRSAIDNLPVVVPRNKDGSSGQLTPTGLRIKELWRDVLENIAEVSFEINPSSDFFHVGGNSLLIVKLRFILQEVFGLTIPLAELVQRPTLSEMAEYVEGFCSKQKGNIRNSKEIHWESEIDSLLQSLPESTELKSGTAIRRSSMKILLTGATGFLGSHILRRLVDDDGVDEVHCVAIRADSMGRPRHVSTMSGKIIEYSGDLSEPLLGLSAEDFAWLSGNVDLIIHNGAQVSYMMPYQALRAVNVVSTRTLCKIALGRKIPFHFISSAAVASIPQSSSNVGPLPEVSVTAWVPPPDPHDGYVLSKWVSEALLEKFASDFGLPVSIHRIVSIIGAGSPALDLMSAIINFSRLMGTVPSLEGLTLQGSFDLVAVDDASRSLVHETLTSTKLHEAGARYIHHFGEKVPPIGLKVYMEESHGHEFKQVPIMQWLDSALLMGLNRVVYEYLVELTTSGNAITLPVICK